MKEVSLQLVCVPVLQNLSALSDIYTRVLFGLSNNHGLNKQSPLHPKRYFPYKTFVRVNLYPYYYTIYVIRQTYLYEISKSLPQVLC